MKQTFFFLFGFLFATQLMGQNQISKAKVNVTTTKVTTASQYVKKDTVKVPAGSHIQSYTGEMPGSKTACDKQVDKLNGQIADLKKTIDSQKSQLAKSGNATQELKDMTEERDRLLNQMSQLQSEYDDLKAKYTKLKSESSKAQADVRIGVDEEGHTIFATAKDSWYYINKADGKKVFLSNEDRETVKKDSNAASKSKKTAGGTDK